MLKLQVIRPEWKSLQRRTWMNLKKKLQQSRILQSAIARRTDMMLVLTAFLLGRAMILEELSPFLLPFFAVIFFMRKEMTAWIFGAALIGNMFSFVPDPVSAASMMILYVLIQKGLEKSGRSDLSSAPIAVFITAFSVGLFGYVMSNALTWYGLMLNGVEAVLSFILTLIFIQSIPVFTLKKKNYQLRSEEIICLMIMLASMMTGTVGWLTFGLSIEHIMSRYLILLFAFVGGAPIGASVGVVTGLILSLASVNAVYQISVLAFSGMLAGLLKEGKKLAVSLGLLLGTSILSLYLGNTSQIFSSTWESMAAIALFLLTPRGIIQTIAKYVPGTQENLNSQHDYARRVRDVTADRVKQFSDVFKQLSRSFTQITQNPGRKEEEMGHFMNMVAEKSCATCFKQKSCWEDKFYQTYKYMTDVMTEVENNPNFSPKDIPQEWERSCVKTKQVLEIMKQQYELYKHNQHWKQQIVDSRQLVAEQLFGVSQVMEDLAKEIRRGSQELFMQEEQIRQSLEELGLSIHSVDIISLDEGNVEIEIVHQYNKGFDECRKIIAPLLSEILSESIAVKKEQFLERGSGYYMVTFGSAKEFEVETGIAGAAKGGGLLSGDSFSTVELGNGKFAVALSDGMGNGERASTESKTALSILQQLLQSGMDEKLAIKSVNSVLLLRSPDEIYATIDVALIDQYNAQTTFMKIGSTPSFIKRGNEVIPIKASNLPVGILQDIEVDLVTLQLQPGDTLIMMTDGIYDAPGHAVNKELWMKRVIQEMSVEDPQEIADCLLEKVVRHHHGDIHDDMTVIVAKIHKYKPEWATFRWPGFKRLERPKTVS
ncbi:stage II sporulation protein E [Marinicrinis lubricantis]|uniref:Stage II sporulation protein E n=1 Tax=Marinicrinis lubricantis TaxID=2086470 RepID=A0ABW1IPT0_9BACL